jgi:GAF domain-containing protein
MPTRPPRRRIWQLPDPAPEVDRTSESDLALLRDLTHALLRAESAEEALQFALDRTCPAVGASLGSVFVVDGASELMRLVAAHGWPERLRPWLGAMRVRVGFGPSGEAVAERRVIEVPDVFADAALEDWQEVARELEFGALVALPLLTPDVTAGAATFYFSAPGTPTPRVRALLRAAADVMAAMAEKATLRDRVRRAEAALEEQRPPEPPRIPDAEPTIE